MKQSIVKVSGGEFGETQHGPSCAHLGLLRDGRFQGRNGFGILPGRKKLGSQLPAILGSRRRFTGATPTGCVGIKSGNRRRGSGAWWMNLRLERSLHRRIVGAASGLERRSISGMKKRKFGILLEQCGETLHRIRSLTLRDKKGEVADGMEKRVLRRVDFGGKQSDVESRKSESKGHLVGRRGSRELFG